MRLVVNLDAKTSELFNEIKGAASIGAFAAICVKSHLLFLQGKHAKENEPVHTDKIYS